MRDVVILFVNLIFVNSALRIRYMEATIAAIRAGFTCGGTLASLEATKMGVPVYLRLGFREILRYRNYLPGTV
jgi:hypothetical protein